MCIVGNLLLVRKRGGCHEARVDRSGRVLRLGVRTSGTVGLRWGWLLIVRVWLG